MSRLAAQFRSRSHLRPPWHLTTSCSTTRNCCSAATRAACCGRSPAPVPRCAGRPRSSTSSGSGAWPAPIARARCCWSATRRAPARCGCWPGCCWRQRRPSVWSGAELPRWAGPADALLAASVDGRHPRVVAIIAEASRRGLEVCVVAPPRSPAALAAGRAPVAALERSVHHRAAHVGGADPAAAGSRRAWSCTRCSTASWPNWPTGWTRSRSCAGRPVTRSPIRPSRSRPNWPSRSRSSPARARWPASRPGCGSTRFACSGAGRRCRSRCPMAARPRWRCCRARARRPTTTSSVIGSTRRRPCRPGWS